VLIAQAVLLLECGQTNRRGQTDATERPIHAGGYAGVSNYKPLALNDSLILSLNLPHLYEMPPLRVNPL